MNLCYLLTLLTIQFYFYWLKESFVKVYLCFGGVVGLGLNLMELVIFYIDVIVFGLAPSSASAVASNYFAFELLCSFVSALPSIVFAPLAEYLSIAFAMIP